MNFKIYYKFLIINVLYNYNIFDDNIIILIFNFIKFQYILRDFINLNLLNWDNLSLNINSIDLFKNNKYINNLNIENICKNQNKHISDIIYKLNINIIIFFKKYNKLLMNNSNYIDLIKENIDKIDWNEFSNNTNGIEILEKHKNKINWSNLSKNKNAINLFKNKIHFIDFNNFLLNPNINYFINKLYINLEDFYDINDINLKYKLNWKLISENCKNINFLEKNYKYINWSKISSNIEAILLIENRLKFENNLSIEKYNELFYNDKINWKRLTKNKNAIKILIKNIDKIYWDDLALNENAIDLLNIYIKQNKNINKIFWENLALNFNAIYLLKIYIKKNKNISYKFWENLSLNPTIFEYI